MLKRRLATAEAIVVKAEPQVLVYWERGGRPRSSFTHCRTCRHSGDAGELLSYGHWLDPHCAHAFKAALNQLFDKGQAFNIILKTKADGYLEADGRAAGGRAVLRLRDVAGYRRDLGRIQDAHRSLARDIRATRAMLNALPNPVWIKDANGRLSWVNAAYVKAVEASSDAEVIDAASNCSKTRQRQALERGLAENCAYRAKSSARHSRSPRHQRSDRFTLGDATAAVALDVSAVETARRNSASIRRLRAHARPRGDRRRHLRSRPAPHLLQRGLPRAVAARRRLARHQADRRRAARPPARTVAACRRLSTTATGRPRSCPATRPAPNTRTGGTCSTGRTIHVVSAQRPDGGLTYLYDDDTERFALESRYNALIDVQRETLDSLKEGVAVFATDGRLKLFNSALADLARLAAARWTKARTSTRSSALSLQSLRSEGMGAHQPRRHRHLRRRQPVAGQMLRPDQSVIDFAVSPLPDGATLITFVDVTDVQALRADADRAQRGPGRGRPPEEPVHQPRVLRAENPLTNIIGFSELLSSPRTGDLNGKQREYLNDISASSRTLLAIINDILDLATIDAGALELKLAPVRVGEVIDAAVPRRARPGQRARLNLDIRDCRGCRGIHRRRASASGRCSTICSRTPSASPSEASTIRLAARREAGMMVFAVEDQGVGIPKEQQPRVLERFESRSQGSKHRGAGLGLSIVKSLVELHGGTVELKSEPGHGTRVTVRFPERGELKLLAGTAA